MSEYKILKSRPQRYHKSVISAGFRVLEKYNKEILKFCRMRPRVRQLSPEEVYSDLVIDRMPRWVSGCRLSVQDIQEVLETDTSGIKRRDKRKYNLQAIVAQVELCTAQLSSLSKQDSQGEKGAAALERLKKATAQFEWMMKLRSVRIKEKRLLSYLCVCIKTTKCKYLQATKADTMVHTADPTNGLLGISDRHNYTTKPTSQVDRMQEYLQRHATLTAEGRRVIVEVLVLDRSFIELGEILSVSRTTAARRYQEAVKQLRKELSKFEMTKELLTK